MVDFHTHILPGIDDGSESLEESLQMLRAEKEQGISRVVLTPHFYPQRDIPESFLKKREEAFGLLQQAAEQEELPELVLGAEVYYYPCMSESAALKELTLDKTEYVLVEMPFVAWTKDMYRELENIYARQGLTPIVAHVDRYIRPWRTRGIPERLQELPVLVQANASFFTSRFTGSLARKLLKEKKIHLLGSDCHDMLSRPPCLGKLGKNLNREALLQIEETESRIFVEDGPDKGE